MSMAATGLSEKKIRYDQDGSYKIYEYDLAGNQIKLSVYRSDGSFDKSTANEYDDKGRKIRETLEGEVWIDSTYEYNDNGVLIRVNRNGLGSIDTLEYDDSGKLIKSITRHPDGSFSGCETHEYDSAGRETVKNVLAEDGTIKEYIRYDYNGDDKMISMTSYSADDTPKYKLEFDTDRNRIHDIYYRENGTVNSETFYRYTEDGKKQHRTVIYEIDGTIRKENDWE